MTSERAYTLREIDEMRKLVFDIETYHDDCYEYKSAKARAEEHLRTYMIGGLDPQELRDKWAKIQQEVPRYIDEEF